VYRCAASSRTVFVLRTDV